MDTTSHGVSVGGSGANEVGVERDLTRNASRFMLMRSPVVVSVLVCVARALMRDARSILSRLLRPACKEEEEEELWCTS